jgi:hypothetical protein
MYMHITWGGLPVRAAPVVLVDGQGMLHISTQPTQQPLDGVGLLPCISTTTV